MASSLVSAAVAAASLSTSWSSAPVAVPVTRRSQLRTRTTLVRCSAASSSSRASASVQEKKAALVRAVARAKRSGSNLPPEERAPILRLIEELEAENPTRDTAKDPRLGGKWSLLYTAPTKAETENVAGRLEGPFLARFRALSKGPAEVKERSITQVIDADAGKVSNIAEFTFGGKPGTLSINGSAEVAPGDPTIRCLVTFLSFSIKLGWLNLSLPLNWISPKGWIDTTYLDDDLRISRGDKGSVFVAAKAKS
eukprot:jgi/Chlat1/5643/Chrsp369S05396